MYQKFLKGDLRGLNATRDPYVLVPGGGRFGPNSSRVLSICGVTHILVWPRSDFLFWVISRPKKSKSLLGHTNIRANLKNI